MNINSIKGGINMPNQDRTGPDGKGPMTGRKQGKCNDNNTNQENRGLGRGRGLRRRATI